MVCEKISMLHFKNNTNYLIFFIIHYPEIFIDYPFEESEWDNIKDYSKYIMHFFDKEHNFKDNVVHFDKIDEVKLAIEVIRGSKQ